MQATCMWIEVNFRTKKTRAKTKYNEAGSRKFPQEGKDDLFRKEAMQRWWILTRQIGYSCRKSAQS